MFNLVGNQYLPLYFSAYVREKNNLNLSAIYLQYNFIAFIFSINGIWFTISFGLMV